MKGFSLILIISIFLTACGTTPPAPQEFPLADGKHKICFIGDTGHGGETQARVAKTLKAEKCASIHHVGDIVYPSGISSLQDPQLERKFLRFYKASPGEKGPLINLVLGNHDHRGNPGAWLKLGQKDPQINFPHPFYLQNINGLCLVHLDSNYYKLFFDIGKALNQSSWLINRRSDLKEKCLKTMAITHHPYLSRGTDHGNARGSMKFFLKNQIIGKFDYLVSGHEHILSDEGVVEGTRLLISGAAGQPDENEEAGYLVFDMEVSKGKMSGLEYHFRKVPLTE